MDFLLILLLIVVNGVFSMSELAVVSARKSRLQQWAGAGRAEAQTALALASQPGPFLSTVQVGITSVAILTGALGEAVLAGDLARHLAAVPGLAAYSSPLALGLVVLIITYLSVVIGELVPKRLALLNPEGIATAVARPMHLLSRIAAPLVGVLNWSSEAILELLGAKPSGEPPVTEEEIKVLMDQGTKAGVFEASEKTLVANILRLDEQRLTDIMTPRMDILFLDLEQSSDENRERIVASPYSRLPVCRGGLDNVLGVVSAKHLLARQLGGHPLDLTAAVQPPVYVPETLSPNELLETFKKTRQHLALIVDEYGEIQGLVTMNDVMEAIVGDIPSAEQPEESDAVRREDGSWLLDGMLSLEKFRQIFGIEEMQEDSTGNVHTIGGFAMLQLGKVPKVADHFEWRGLRFEVVDMDRNRVDKVLVVPPPPPPEDPGEAGEAD
jgi:magnesium and cobalt exporter, CNNM family